MYNISIWLKSNVHEPFKRISFFSFEIHIIKKIISIKFYEIPIASFHFNFHIFHAIESIFKQTKNFFDSLEDCMFALNMEN